jgi:5-methylcytosine-specific restriction endonuclease McrA
VSVQKRHVTPLARQLAELEAIAQIAAQAAHTWNAYVSVEAALAAPTLKAAGGNGDTVHSSDVPDPTWAIVASLGVGEITGIEETREAIGGALTQMRYIQRLMGAKLRQHPDVASESEAIAKALRCDGSVDPTCTRNAVRGGKCWACYQKLRRERDNGTPNVVNVSLVEVGPSTVDATCGRCGSVFPASTQAEALELLAAHKAEEHAA